MRAVIRSTCLGGACYNLLDMLLGQSGVSFSKPRDRDCLFPIDRRVDRDAIGWSEELPFIGYDHWNHYEFSFILPNRLPFQGLVWLRYSSASPRLIESKSLKLYLNSFVEISASRDEVKEMISQDLSRVVGVSVLLQVLSLEEGAPLYAIAPRQTGSLLESSEAAFHPFEGFEGEAQPTETSERVYRTQLLRSLCKVTRQPDWGTAWIRMKGDVHPQEGELLAYILSYRYQCHFHEEVAERMMYDLLEKFSPVELEIRLNYTRRGGLDINPVRLFPRTLMVDEGQWLAVDPWLREIRQ